MYRKMSKNDGTVRIPKLQILHCYLFEFECQLDKCIERYTADIKGTSF